MKKLTLKIMFVSLVAFSMLTIASVNAANNPTPQTNSNNTTNNNTTSNNNNNNTASNNNSNSNNPK